MFRQPPGLSHYDILEVKPNASLLEIQNKYNELVRRYHLSIPENQKKPFLKEVAPAILDRINQAYDVLSDPIKKADYDRELALTPQSFFSFHIPYPEKEILSSTSTQEEHIVKLKGLLEHLKEEKTQLEESVKGRPQEYKYMEQTIAYMDVAAMHILQFINKVIDANRLQYLLTEIKELSPIIITKGFFFAYPIQTKHVEFDKILEEVIQLLEPLNSTKNLGYHSRGS